MSTNQYLIKELSRYYRVTVIDFKNTHQSLSKFTCYFIQVHFLVIYVMRHKTREFEKEV